MNLANYLEAAAIVMLSLPQLATMVRRLKAPTSIDAIKADLADVKTGLFYVGTVASKLEGVLPPATTGALRSVEKATEALGPPGTPS